MNRQITALEQIADDICRGVDVAMRDINMLARAHKQDVLFSRRISEVNHKLGTAKGSLWRLKSLCKAMSVPELQFKKGGQRVYVMGFADYTIKIGVTNDSKRRVREVQRDWGRRVVKVCRTYGLNDAFYLEKIMHETFKAARITGEYFRVPFEVAVDFMQRYVSEVYYDERD